MVLAILASLFWIIGVTWAPSWIKKQVEEYSQQLGYSVQIQSISVKPFQLTARVEGLRLQQIQGKQLFALDAGLIRLHWSKLMTGELGIRDLQLTNPSILLERAQGDGSKWNCLSVFGSLEVIATAVAAIAVHHVGFFFFLPSSVFNYEASPNIVILRVS